MFNDQIYNGVSSLTPPTPGPNDGVITVGSTDSGYFDLGGHTVTLLRYLSGKDISVDREQFQDSGVVYNRRGGLMKILVEGTIKGTSRSDVLSKVDTMKSDLGGKKYLKVSDSGNIRRCLAVCTNHDFSERRTDITIQVFKLEFETYDFMEEVTAVDLSATFSSAYTFNIARTGTADAKLWITLNFTSATSVTSLTVNIAGVSIVISTSITAGTVIIIDGEKMAVTKNGASIAYTGTISKLKSANNSITITPNGTYSIGMVASYRPAYT